VTPALFAKHRLVGIDSNVLIYLLEGTGAMADAAGALLDAIAGGEAHGIFAMLGVAELCSGPARGGDGAMVDRYADELSTLDGVSVVPLVWAIATDAALIRGAGPLSLADAIHLATARSAGATAFVTNDRRIKSVSGLEVAYLDELVLG
jgi:predicted nucleic acid-binding protein